MTIKAETLARLLAVSDSVSEEFYDILADQAKKAACNMLMSYGDDACVSAAGFVTGVVNAHEAALLWALAEGHVVLADSAKADDVELRERSEKRQTQEASASAPLRSVPAGASAYL